MTGSVQCLPESNKPVQLVWYDEHIGGDKKKKINGGRCIRCVHRHRKCHNESITLNTRSSLYLDFSFCYIFAASSLPFSTLKLLVICHFPLHHTSFLRYCFILPHPLSSNSFLCCISHSLPFGECEPSLCHLPQFHLQLALSVSPSVFLFSFNSASSPLLQPSRLAFCSHGKYSFFCSNQKVYPRFLLLNARHTVNNISLLLQKHPFIHSFCSMQQIFFQSPLHPYQTIFPYLSSCQSSITTWNWTTLYIVYAHKEMHTPFYTCIHTLQN